MHELINPMGVRQIGRARALQLLYALEFRASDDSFAEVERRFLRVDPVLRRGWGPFPSTLAQMAFEQGGSLDEAIRPLLKSWTLERLPRLERLCLRMALCELRHFPDIPSRVTINEYIELARRFGNEDATPYVNAVLDRLAREFPEKDFEAAEAPPGRTARPAAPRHSRHEEPPK